MQSFIKTVLRMLYIIVFRPKFVGRENLLEDTPYILCPNHVGTLDAAGIILCSKRRIIFIVKEELYKHKIIKWLCTLFEMIPVKREENDIGAIKKSLKVLKSNDILGIFPEGTRKGLEKNVKIKDGAAFIALKSKVQVVPLGIQGSFKPFTQVKFNYGKPLDFCDIDQNLSEKEVLEEMTKQIMDNIIRLTNEKI